MNRTNPAPGLLGPLELGQAGVSKRVPAQVVISGGNPSFRLGEGMRAKKAVSDHMSRCTGSVTSLRVMLHEEKEEVTV